MTRLIFTPTVLRWSAALAAALSLSACAPLVLGTAAQAHMPYLLPTLFDVGTGDHVTVTTSFGEAMTGWRTGCTFTGMLGCEPWNSQRSR